MATRRFEYVKGSSSKFWEVARRGSTLTVRYGRIGSNGRELRKALASADQAKEALDELVREKLGKGYEEVGTRRNKRKTATRARPRAEKRGGEIGFTAEQDALHRLGFPYLRVLTDEKLTPKKASSLAKKALEVIDPLFGVAWPRDVARRFLLAYTAVPFYRLTRRQKRVQAEAIASDREVDEATLERILDALMPVGTETYEFRVREVLFLLEAFLGVEVVAKAVVRHLVKAGRSAKPWGPWGEPDRANATAHHVAMAFGFLRLRASKRMWRGIVAPLGNAKVVGKLATFGDVLACLADDRRTPQNPYFLTDLALQRGHAGPLRARFEEFPRPGFSARFYLVAGVELLERAQLAKLSRHPKWFQLRWIDELGTIRAPGVVLGMAYLLGSRAASDAARQWLRDHERYARSVLATAPTAHARAVAGAIAVLDGGELPPKRSNKQLRAEIKAMYRGIEAQMLACKGNRKRELAVMRAAYDLYCEARAAMGEIGPGEFFTHGFVGITSRWKVSDEVARRWTDLAVEVAGS